MRKAAAKKAPAKKAPAKKAPAKKTAAKAKAVHVVMDGDRWAVIREGNKRPTAKFDTQKAAWEAALKMAKKDKALAVKKGKDGSVKEKKDFGA